MTATTRPTGIPRRPPSSIPRCTLNIRARTASSPRLSAPYYRRRSLPVSILTLTTSPTASFGAVRRWTKIDDFIQEMANARIYDGVHYRNPTEVGTAMGKQIGELVAAKYLRPLRLERARRGHKRLTNNLGQTRMHQSPRSWRPSLSLTTARRRQLSAAPRARRQAYVPSYVFRPTACRDERRWRATCGRIVMLDGCTTRGHCLERNGPMPCQTSFVPRIDTPPRPSPSGSH